MYSLLQNNFISHTWRTFQLNKTMAFGQLASAVLFFAKFPACTRKSLSDFWPPLLEKPIKFVLNFKKSKDSESSNCLLSLIISHAYDLFYSGKNVEGRRKNLDIQRFFVILIQ